MQEFSQIAAEFINNFLWQNPFPFMEEFMDENAEMMLPAQAFVNFNITVAVSKT